MSENPEVAVPGDAPEAPQKTSAILRAEASVLLERSNALANYRMGAEHAALPDHARDLIAAQATAEAHLLQILNLRAKFYEARGE